MARKQFVVTEGKTLDPDLLSLHQALDRPRKSLNTLKDIFRSFEETGPFHKDWNLNAIKQVTTREALFTKHSNKNPWYEYVLKRIAIPEWFDRLDKSVSATQTIEQWNNLKGSYLWDEILGDLVNKAPYLDEAGEAKGMCESFRNFLTSAINQNSGEKERSLILLREGLEVFIKDLKVFRDKYKSFQESQIKGEFDSVANVLRKKMIKYASPKIERYENIQKNSDDLLSARDALRLKAEEYSLFQKSNLGRAETSETDNFTLINEAVKRSLMFEDEN